MKNIRGKSVKKSRDWIQEKKVRWPSFGLMKTHLKNTRQQMWNLQDRARRKGKDVRPDSKFTGRKRKDKF